jgi:metal-responsive CopG/Arc/MetJ family transcriptional regulator
MRTIISIPDAQAKLLDKLSEKEDISRSELIRQAINYYLETHFFPNAEEQAFGLLKGKIKDGITYQDKIRSEWE